MTFKLPPSFSSDINHLGAVIQFYDDLSDEHARRDHLRAGMRVACSLLKELEASQRELSSTLDEIDPNNRSEADFVRDELDLFLKIEDLILRDAGIDRIARKIILNNLRSMARFAVARDQHRGIFGEEVIVVLKNLKVQVCERSDQIAKNPQRTKELLSAALTFGLPPINIAASVLNVAFLPVVFKASAYVGTVVSKSILSS